MKKTQILSGIVASLVCALPAQAVQSDYIGQAWFPKGDSIEITAVGRNENLLTVAGHYNLVSHERATLRLYITTTNKNVGEGKTTPLEITRGRGDFALAYGPLVAGLPHISMYPVQGGESFASLYFGTKEEAAEERRMKLGRETGGERGGSSPTAAPLTLEYAPPVVVKTVPTAGATDVDPGLAEIKVTYSKAMQDGSWSWSTWGEENYPETTGKPKYLGDVRTCVLFVKLQPGKFYAIWLNSDKFKNFTDTGGRAAVPYLLTFHTASSGGASAAPADARPAGTKVKQTDAATDASLVLLNEDQRAVLAWTDRQFRGFFDNRRFEGWSEAERTELETKSIDALKGPRTQDYYRAINTLGALHSAKALPELRGIACERTDRNNRDRWMAIRALGFIGDKADVAELIHLVYHGNVNTRWWAQISLVRITGQNFGRDWNAWGKWWNDQKGEPPYKPEIIRWWDGQVEPDKLAQSLNDGDQKFLAELNGKSAATQTVSSSELAAKVRAAEPTMSGIRENWTATVAALDGGDNAAALAAAQRLTPNIQDFLDKFRGTSLEPGTAKALDLIKSLTTALEKDDQAAVRTSRSAMATLGRSMEEQIKAIVEGTANDSFARCRIVSFGGEKSEGMQSYGGSGPALRFKPAELLSGIGANTPVKLKGVRLYASRYGRSYTPEETKMRVILRDAKDSTLGEASFAYAKFGFEAAWVDLVFEQPLTITQPGEPVTLAFDPEATQTKGIYFHFQKNPTTSHSLVGTVSSGFKELPDHEWLMRVAFE